MVRVNPVSPLARSLLQIVQLQLQKEVVFTLVPMTRELQTQRRKFAQWKSQSLEDSSSVGAIAPNTLTINFKPRNTIQFLSPRPDEVSSGIYYVPESPSQIAFDSFIVENGVLHIFQFTIAESHSIEGGLMDFFSYKSLHKILQEKELYIIFVIPRGGKLVCPESSDERLKKFWKNAKFFITEVDPKKK